MATHSLHGKTEHTDISIVLIYNHNSEWNFSATWVYNTGNAVTFPSGNYWLDGRLVPYYTERNGYRMPAYHRLDLSATWTLDRIPILISLYIMRIIGWIPMLSISNKTQRPETRHRRYRRPSSPIIPSVTYNFTFLEITKDEFSMKIENIKYLLRTTFILLGIALNSCQEVVSIDLNKPTRTLSRRHHFRINQPVLLLRSAWQAIILNHHS